MKQCMDVDAVNLHNNTFGAFLVDSRNNTCYNRFKLKNINLNF